MIERLATECTGSRPIDVILEYDWRVAMRRASGLTQQAAIGPQFGGTQRCALRARKRQRYYFVLATLEQNLSPIVAHLGYPARSPRRMPEHQPLFDIHGDPS
jgi:hypothetical protein